MPKKKIASVSMSYSFWRACKKFRDNYSIAFSKLVRNALMKYINCIKNNSYESETLRLIARLEQIDEKSMIIRRHRDSVIRNGSGVKEIKELRVSGQIKREFRPARVGLGWKKGQIVDVEEREIYGELCNILEELNKERKKILRNPVLLKWLKES